MRRRERRGLNPVFRSCYRPLRAYLFFNFIHNFINGIPLGASAEERVRSKIYISLGSEPKECKTCGTPSTSGGISPSFPW